MFGRRGSRSVEIDTRSASPHPGRRAPILAHGQIASQTQFLSHRRQTHPQHSNSSRGRNSPLPPKPKNRPKALSSNASLALNLDPVPVRSTHPHLSVTPSVSHPAQVSSPLFLIQPGQSNSLPSSSTRALYQIQPRAHPRLSELQARIPLSVSLPVFQSQTPAVR